MRKKTLFKGGLVLLMILANGCASASGILDATKTLVDSLSKDEFTVSDMKPASSSNQGLSDPSNVGVNKTRFDNERLYGSENLTVGVTLNYADYGMSGTDSKDDTAALIAMIDKASEYPSQLVKIVLPSGDLDFIEQVNTVDNSAGIVLKGAKNIILSGNNTHLYFHGETKGFLLQNSENIYFENLTIDWGVPPTSTARILESDGQVFRVEVLNGFNVDENTRISAFLEFSKSAFTPRTRGNDIYGDVKSTQYLGDNILEVTFKSKHSVPPVGTLVALRHYLYEYDCFFINQCKNIFFESVTIYSAPGMGVRCHSSENIYFNRFSTQLKPNMSRLMTVTADALHFIDCVGDIKVTNSLFEYCGDDALNEHGMYLSLIEIYDEHSVYAVNPRGYNFAPKVGDKIEISTTLDLSLVQTLTVQHVTVMNPGFAITFVESLNAQVKVNDVLSDVTRSPKLLFENNIVRNKRCRGVLVQTRGATISNNTFANLSDAGILMTCDANDWFESVASENVLIQNNKFLKNNFGVGNTGGDIAISGYGKGYNLAAVGTIKHVEIKNNFFGNSANAGIFANSVDNLDIQNNLMFNVGILPKSSTFENGIYIAYSSNIKLINNVVNLNASASFSTIKIGPSVNTDEVIVSNNIGFDESNIKTTILQVVFALPRIPSGTSLSLSGTDFDAWLGLDESLAITGISDVDLNVREPNDTTFKINALRVGYDDTGLYIGYDVFDNEVRYASTSSFWEGDGVEIFLTSNTESQDPMNLLRLSDDSCLELFMSGNQTYGNQIVELRTSAAIVDKKDQIHMSFVEKSNGQGYVGKAFIPFTIIPSIKTAIDSGTAFAFTVNFNDLDSTDIRVQYASCANPVEYNKCVPYKMSKLTTGGIES